MTAQVNPQQHRLLWMLSRAEHRGNRNATLHTFGSKTGLARSLAEVGLLTAVDETGTLFRLTDAGREATK